MSNSNSQEFLDKQISDSIFNLILFIGGVATILYVLIAIAKWILLFILALPFSLAIHEALYKRNYDKNHYLLSVLFCYLLLSLVIIGIPGVYSGILFSKGLFGDFFVNAGAFFNSLISEFQTVIPKNIKSPSNNLIKNFSATEGFIFYHSYYLGMILASVAFFQLVGFILKSKQKSEPELVNPKDKRTSLLSILFFHDLIYRYIFLKPFFSIRFKLFDKHRDLKVVPLRFKKYRGVYIGRQWHTNRKVFLTPENLNLHTQIIGGSGAGKSNLIKLISEQRVGEGLGLIILDFKQDFDTFSWITGLCEATERLPDLKVFTASNSDISRGYNPLSWGTSDQVKSRIMGSLDISEDGAGKHYKDQADGHLQVILDALVEIRDSSGQHFTLLEIYNCLYDIRTLEALSLRDGLSESSKVELLRTLERLKTKDGLKEVTAIITALRSVIKSAAGPLLTGSESLDQTNRINLKEDIESGKILYILMDSMSDFQTSKIMGRLFLQDLIGTVAKINSEKRVGHTNPVSTQVIIDEFASFATPNFTELIAKARSAGVGIAVAHQSRDDLNEINETFCKRVEDNCATKLVFRTSSADNAEYFANSIGTKRTTKETRVTGSSLFGRVETEKGSLREVDTYIIHPNVFKNLRTGQLIKISGLRDAESSAVDIDLATEFKSNNFLEVLEQAKNKPNKLERLVLKRKYNKPSLKEEKKHLEDEGVFL